MKNIIALITLLICSAAQAQDVREVSAWAIDPPIERSDEGRPEIATAAIDTSRAVAQCIITGTELLPQWQLSTYVQSKKDAHASTDGYVAEHGTTLDEMWFVVYMMFTEPDDPTHFEYTAEIRLSADNHIKVSWQQAGYYLITGTYVDFAGNLVEDLHVVKHEFQTFGLLVIQQGLDGTAWMSQESVFKSDGYDSVANTVRLAKVQHFIMPPPPEPEPFEMIAEHPEE